VLGIVVVAVAIAVFGGGLFERRGATANVPSRTDGAPPSDPGLATPAVPPVPGHEVYGFVPYWEMDEGIAEHLAATDLTTLALFSVTHNLKGELSLGENGYRRIAGPVGRRMLAEAHERGTRVEITYTSFGEDKNRAFYDNAEAQARWIEVLVEFVDEQGFDGINVDVESLPLEQVPAYGAWVGRLRSALRERVPEAQVSVSTQANHTGAAMAAVAAAAGADRIFLMGYDYHTAGTDPGASSPIDRYDGADRDLVWSLDRYAELGVPVERTLLGLPLYGVTWPVSGPGLGAPSLGRGDSWVPRRNLDVLHADGFEPAYDPIESVEFHVVESEGDAPWTALYYDSPRSLTPKLALADARGLAGAGFWAIGYERGLPAYTELIATFRAGELPAAP
jgi:spore germination protein YaaH